MRLHRLLDHEFDAQKLDAWLAEGDDPNATHGEIDETPQHVAVRRRRLEALDPLLAAGAAIDARTRGGKSAWVHAYRRGFDEICEALAERGAVCEPNDADQLAALLTQRRIDEAQALLEREPELARSTNPEEARVLPDVVGYDRLESCRLLLDHGAEIAARGLDGGTALHVTAWFGAPHCTELLIERGAPLELRCVDHDLTPLGWAAHGSQYSGAADERQEVYVEIVERLLQAGAVIEPGVAAMASPQVQQLLRR